jgi:hypothetical protein
VAAEAASESSRGRRPGRWRRAVRQGSLRVGAGAWSVRKTEVKARWPKVGARAVRVGRSDLSNEPVQWGPGEEPSIGGPD